MPILGIVNASKSNFRGVAGYAAGGNAGSYFSNIDKITFPADTKTTLSATLTSARYTLYGMANAATAGYTLGGDDGAGRLNSIDKITFPADTKTTLSATLTNASENVSGFADSGVL